MPTCYEYNKKENGVAKWRIPIDVFDSINTQPGSSLNTSAAKAPFFA